MSTATRMFSFSRDVNHIGTEIRAAFDRLIDPPAFKLYYLGNAPAPYRSPDDNSHFQGHLDNSICALHGWQTETGDLLPTWLGLEEMVARRISQSTRMDSPVDKNLEQLIECSAHTVQTGKWPTRWTGANVAATLPRAAAGSSSVQNWTTGLCRAGVTAFWPWITARWASGFSASPHHAGALYPLADTAIQRGVCYSPAQQNTGSKWCLKIHTHLLD